MYQIKTFKILIKTKQQKEYRNDSKIAHQLLIYKSVLLY